MTPQKKKVHKDATDSYVCVCKCGTKITFCAFRNIYSILEKSVVPPPAGLWCFGVGHSFVNILVSLTRYQSALSYMEITLKSKQSHKSSGIPKCYTFSRNTDRLWEEKVVPFPPTRTPSLLNILVLNRSLFPREIEINQ